MAILGIESSLVPISHSQTYVDGNGTRCFTGGQLRGFQRRTSAGLLLNRWRSGKAMPGPDLVVCYCEAEMRRRWVRRFGDAEVERRLVFISPMWSSPAPPVKPANVPVPGATLTVRRFEGDSKHASWCWGSNGCAFTD
nr:hypothetical protein Iba_chr14dCG3570 [Ipomoea batatas]